MSAAGAGTNAIRGSISFPVLVRRADALTSEWITSTTLPERGQNALEGGYVVIDDVFGVVDHNTANEATARVPTLVQMNYSRWQGAGDYGDNSFASADTFGTAQSLFIENNLSLVSVVVRTMCLRRYERRGRTICVPIQYGCQYVGNGSLLSARHGVERQASRAAPSGSLLQHRRDRSLGMRLDRRIKRWSRVLFQ